MVNNPRGLVTFGFEPQFALQTFPEKYLTSVKHATEQLPVLLLLRLAFLNVLVGLDLTLVSKRVK
jgi:hypothetical protein